MSNEGKHFWVANGSTMQVRGKWVLVLRCCRCWQEFAGRPIKAPADGCEGKTKVHTGTPECPTCKGLYQNGECALHFLSVPPPYVVPVGQCNHGQEDLSKPCPVCAELLDFTEIGRQRTGGK